jgi:hypothetical protein
VAAAVKPTPKPVAGGTYKLAYTKWDGGKHNLFVANTNGQGEQFILGRVARPAWTPDGGAIFFYGEEGIDRQTISGIDYVFPDVANGIVRMNASPIPATLGEVRLYQGPGWNDGTARWANVSPNGQMVAYDAKRAAIIAFTSSVPMKTSNTALKSSANRPIGRPTARKLSTAPGAMAKPASGFPTGTIPATPKSVPAATILSRPGHPMVRPSSFIAMRAAMSTCTP